MSELGRVDAPLMEERDHPLRPWIVTAALLLALLAIAGAFYYAPLVATGSTRCPDGAEHVPPPESEADGRLGEDLCLVTYSRDHDMTFGTSIRNDNVLPITVSGFDFDAAVRELIDIDGVRMGPDGGAAEPLMPFEPFRLAGGQERYVQVDATLLPCELSRAGRVVSLPALPVRTRFVGVARTAEVPMRNEISVLLTDCRP